MHPNFILLHVADPAASAGFYADLLGAQPVEASPSFAMFALESGLMLGLWASRTVEPAATAPGGCELGFPVANAEAVQTTYAAWRDRGLRILQQPTQMDFGLTFTAADPDGHRLRVFAPS